ncbi:MAG: hypothetical protein ACK4V6_11035 [Microthrixaceae bacterium]
MSVATISQAEARKRIGLDALTWRRWVRTEQIGTVTIDGVRRVPASEVARHEPAT